MMIGRDIFIHCYTTLVHNLIMISKQQVICYTFFCKWP